MVDDRSQDSPSQDEHAQVESSRRVESGREEGIPPIEDAADPINSAAGAELDARLQDEEEDELTSSARSMDAPEAEAGESVSNVGLAEPDDTGDAEAIDTTDEASSSDAPASDHIDPTRIVAQTTRRIAVELKTVELEVRRLLDTVDTKRKRKLGGTRRWNELEDDIATWRFAGRHDERTLSRLSELVYRRHYLFRKLTYFAMTRPTWNS